MYLKLKSKIPNRTEIVQLADTWPVKAFEHLVRYFTLYVWSNICLYNREVCHDVVQLADDEYAEIGYTKFGFSFTLNNLHPEVNIRANYCFNVKHNDIHACSFTQAMITTISMHYMGLLMMWLLDKTLYHPHHAVPPSKSFLCCTLMFFCNH